MGLKKNRPPANRVPIGRFSALPSADCASFSFSTSVWGARNFSGAHLDMRPKVTNSPRGMENNSVRKKILQESRSPTANCCVMFIRVCASIKLFRPFFVLALCAHIRKREAHFFMSASLCGQRLSKERQCHKQGRSVRNIVRTPLYCIIFDYSLPRQTI